MPTTKNTLPTFSILVLGLLTLTITLLNTHSLTTQAATNTWDQRGINVMSTYAEDYSSENFKESMRRASSVGVHDVVLIVPYIQSNFYANDLHPSGQTPSDQALINGINTIKSLGMKPSLKVFAESPDGWRAYINPSDREGWFYNYSNILKKYATIAQQNGVGLFCIGTEMIKLTSAAENPDNTRRWKQLITDVRSVYKGRVTYSAQFDRSWWDEIDNLGFLGDLDDIGISAYYHLTDNNNPSVDELKNQWGKIEPGDIGYFSNKYNKPIIFTEFGYKSMDRAFEVPGDWSINSNFNEANQAKGYEAFFQYFSNVPYFAGVHLWDWSTNPNAGGQGNTDYTPQNKSAQDVMKKYFMGNSNTPANSSSSSNISSSSSAQSSMVISSDPNISSVSSSLSSSMDSTSNISSASNSSIINSSLSNNGFDVATLQNANNLGVSVTNNSGQNLSNLKIDVEVFDSNNQRVAQIVNPNVNLSNGQNNSFVINAMQLPQNSGTYKIKVGFFSSNWGTNYNWSENAGTYVVNTANSANNTPVKVTPVANSGIQIWWPGDGQTVSGTQPFKARVGENSLGSYKMFWQVDGGSLNVMYDSTQDAPHKETMVDVSNWNWQNSNQYTINFVAEDNNGNIIGQSSAKVTRN